jgi:hypothetical protein
MEHSPTCLGSVINRSWKTFTRIAWSAKFPECKPNRVEYAIGFHAPPPSMKTDLRSSPKKSISVAWPPLCFSPLTSRTWTSKYGRKLLLDVMLDGDEGQKILNFDCFGQIPRSEICTVIRREEKQDDPKRILTTATETS